MSNQDNQDDLNFLEQMKGVKPLKTKSRVIIRKDSKTTPGQQQRKLDATRMKNAADNPLSVEHLELVNPEDVITFSRPGLAHGVFKKLKQGAYPIEAKLDLHHRTVEQAREAVRNFIVDCQKYDARTGIILHGKGALGDPPALLKSFTNRWLKQIPEVLAFHTAKPNQGGAGAVYVLVKKSENKKQSNREKYR